MKSVIINGGNRSSSRLSGIEQEIKSLLNEYFISYDTTQVYQLPAHDLITANYKSDIILHNIEKINEADIVFVLTPIYKGSFSGIIKTYLDLLPQKAFENKTVIPIAIGGSIAHLLSLEYSLKPVLSILGATTISSPIYVIDQHVKRLNNGRFLLEEEIKERIRTVWKSVTKKQLVNVR